MERARLTPMPGNACQPGNYFSLLGTVGTGFLPDTYKHILRNLLCQVAITDRVDCHAVDQTAITIV